MPKKLIPGTKKTPVYKKVGFAMPYQGNSSAFPFKSGLGSTAAQPFDVDDLSDLKEQNEAKIKELSKKYQKGEISIDEAQQGYKEIPKYENPE